MWAHEYVGRSTAPPHAVWEVLADPDHWSEWNAGVAAIRREGPFEAGTAAEMVLPDGTVLAFRLTWVEPDRGYEDLTPVPDGPEVRVRHLLDPEGAGTRITYRVEVDGPADVAEEVGREVSADFPDVISALAARAERLGG